MLSDELIAGIAESDKREAATIVKTLCDRHGNEWVDVAVKLAAGGAETINPFARGLIRACDLPPAQEPLRLWFGLYPRSVALFIGESGAGKSSLLYNLCIHAARNEPLWGVKFGMGRPLKVLYVDPENSGNFTEGQGGQCSVKIERIGEGTPESLYFHDGQGVNLANPVHVNVLREFIEAEKFDIVVLDPIANLFGTKDENDNAEAARQMTAITSLSRQTGACVIVVHHTGKNTTGDYGRGASARLGAADVSFMFRAKGEQEESDDSFQGDLKERDDQCRLQIVKNRLEGRGSLYLAMAGMDKFHVSTFENWKIAKSRADSDVSKAIKAEEEIKLFLSDGVWHMRPEIIDAMNREGIGRVNADVALEILESAEEIVCQKLKGKGSPRRYILSSALNAKTPETPQNTLFISSSILNSKEIGIEEEIKAPENPLNDLNKSFFNAPSASPVNETDEEGWK